MKASPALLVLVLCIASCSSPRLEHAAPSATPPASRAPSPPSQNEQLYAEGAALEKAGRWEDAANTYQKYVFAMGDALSYIDRSSMELRIEQLREKAATSRPAE